MADAETRLAQVLARYPDLTIAVSGGVDSLTLATFAGRMAPVTVAHAVSPAVPAEATQRVSDLAQSEGWTLRVLNAGEFNDPAYLSNPLNRCYFCKTNLYARIREVVTGTIAAGTNTDDLGEYRPGLQAASQHGVVHPYVEADVSKADLRALAARLGLGEIATLPAQPCLASRVETGIPIRAEDLAFIHRVEQAVRQMSGLEDVRCRLTGAGVRLETSGALPEASAAHVAELCRTAGRAFVGVAPYRRGSAFVAQGSQ